jgi:hypothetical protein
MSRFAIHPVSSAAAKAQVIRSFMSSLPPDAE